MNVTSFENRVFVDDHVKVKPLSWALIQYDQCPYKKWKFTHTHTHTHKRQHVKMKAGSTFPTSQGMSKISGKLPETRRKAQSGFALTIL